MAMIQVRVIAALFVQATISTSNIADAAAEDEVVGRGDPFPIHALRLKWRHGREPVPVADNAASIASSTLFNYFAAREAIVGSLANEAVAVAAADFADS